MTLYLDASIVVPLLVEEPMTATITGWLARQQVPLNIGRLAIGECASAISRRRRRNELSETESERALATLDELATEMLTVVDNLPADIAHAARLVRVPFPKLLMGDAIHIATCHRLGLTLATHDADLLLIAEREGVAGVSPG